MLIKALSKISVSVNLPPFIHNGVEACQVSLGSGDLFYLREIDQQFENLKLSYNDNFESIRQECENDWESSVKKLFQTQINNQNATGTVI